MIEERTVSYGKYQLKIFNSPVVFLNIKNRKEVSMGNDLDSNLRSFTG